MILVVNWCLILIKSQTSYEFRGVTSTLWKEDFFVCLATDSFYCNFVNLIIWWSFKKHLQSYFARRTTCISIFTGYEFFMLHDLNYINTCCKEEWMFLHIQNLMSSERGRKHTEWLKKRFCTVFNVILDFFLFSFPLMFVALFITIFNSRSILVLACRVLSYVL